MDLRYVFKEGDMVIIYGRVPCKIGILAVGPYKYIRYLKNSGLIAKVED